MSGDYKMFKNISKGQVIEVLVYDNDSGIPITMSGILININKREIQISQDSYPFDTILLSISSIISVSVKDIHENILKILQEYSESAKNLTLKKKEYEKAEQELNQLKEKLIEAKFFETYTVEGAVNYLNNMAKKQPKFSIDENEVSFRFVKTQEDKIEVTIHAARKFEFYNTTNQSDIDKAADTYAPDIKNEISEKMSIFKSVFLVNRKTKKLSDYLYESVSEYSGEFNCTKENFFNQKKDFEEMVKNLTGDVSNG